MIQTSLMALVAVASVLLLVTPARGQSARESAGEAKRIERLISKLSDPHYEIRRAAAYLLGKEGSNAAPAVPALIKALSDEHLGVRVHARMALAAIGPATVPQLVVVIQHGHTDARVAAAELLALLGDPALVAVPALVEATGGDDERVRDAAYYALAGIAIHCEDESAVPYWVVPRVYWKELVGLVLLLAAWFTLAGQFPRHRPKTKLKHLALMAATAAVPVGLSCSAVLYAITREWTLGYLPDTLTLVPFPVAAVLSVGLVCTLPAIWVCQRKPVASELIP